MSTVKIYTVISQDLDGGFDQTLASFLTQEQAQTFRDLLTLNEPERVAKAQQALIEWEELCDQLAEEHGENYSIPTFPEANFNELSYLICPNDLTA